MEGDVNDLSIQFEEEDGTLVCKELGKKILTKGAWTTIMYLYCDLDRKSGEFGPPKVSIRRYQKQNGVYRPRSKFNISSEKQAGQIVDVLSEWYKSPSGE